MKLFHIRAVGMAISMRIKDRTARAPAIAMILCKSLNRLITGITQQQQQQSYLGASSLQTVWSVQQEAKQVR